MSLVYLARFSVLLAAGDVAGIAGWAWLLIFLAISAVVALLLIANAGFSAQSPYLEGLTHGSHDEGETGAGRHAEVQTAHAEPVLATASTVASESLEIIEGIGPRINQILHAAGITSFAQLSETSVERLNEVLHAAGLRLNDPTTWPEQASLAAAGKWPELEELQSRLKGGLHS